MSDRAFARLLRCYPPAWRQRYGDELTALMEDTYGGGGFTIRHRLSIVRAGLTERARAAKLVGGDGPEERVRIGSALILVAWSFFVVAGAGFAKFSEHWDGMTPRAARWLPGDAYTAVRWAAAVGAATIILAVAATLPTLVRSVRHLGWARFRRPVLLAVVVTSVTVGVGGGVVLGAHHLAAHQRNGGVGWYTFVGAVWALMIVATIAACTAAATVTNGRLRLSGRVLRTQGVLALVLAAAMAVILGGTLVWWSAMAVASPHFLASGLYGSSPAPPVMIVVGLLMLVGFGTGATGAGQVARSILSTCSDPA